MNPHDETWLDAVAALAVGALAREEAPGVEAHLASCASCRAEYRELSAACELVGVAASATPATLSESSAARMKRKTLHAAVAARAPVATARGYERVIPSDSLVPFAPGISWAVVPAPGMTLIYWVFEPPACSSLPPEQHVQTQAGIVLDGAMTLHYGDGTEQTCRAGDVYAIAPGTTHGADFLERTVLFESYTPNHAPFEEQYRSSRMP